MYPIEEIIPSLKASLLTQHVVILQAPPGAGKSTVLPLALLEESWLEGKKMLMLEPRRLAARSVAQRMAQVRKEEVGGTVGFRVRFENAVSARTRIEVITEGILTRMIQSDNALDGVNLVIFDEFHERSLQADLALALCYQVQQVLRPDLRILIMSATLDAEKLSSLFNQAPVITSAGRQFPVTFRYASVMSDDPIALRVVRTIRQAYAETTGDMLVFLPGAGEITRVAELLEQDAIQANVFPLYGDLTYKKQQEAILPDPTGRRKIVLATSIAETSLTIEGITVVIDSGLARVPRFDPRSGLTRLETIRVTRDAADQRAGRAGRLGPGTCYRLWTEAIHHQLLPARKPEILEADLAPLVLELSEWGEEVTSLQWVTPPSSGSVSQARELLEILGAVTGTVITAKGRAMAKLPTHPRIAHMLLEAVTPYELSLVCDLAALMEERDPLPRESGADLALRVEVLRKWRGGERVNAERSVLERIERLAAAWRRLLKAPLYNDVPMESMIGALLVGAYPDRIARQLHKHDERYKLANGRMVTLPKHDPLVRHDWLIVAQLDAGKNEGRIYLASAVEETDLEKHATEQRLCRWDAEREAVVGVVEKRIGSVVLSSKPSREFTQEQRNEVLFAVLRDRGLRILNWPDSVDEFRARIMSLRVWRPKEAWPDLNDDALLATLETWLTPFLLTTASLTDLRRMDWLEILTTLVPWELSNQLNALAPARLEVPSGSMIKIQYYPDGRPPEMEVRLQEMFGMLETPVVNNGQTKLIVHLLSPGYKPVQVTQDMQSFWKNTYHEVRKELRNRYPKHSWPDDPFTAKAVRGVRRM